MSGPRPPSSRMAGRPYSKSPGPMAVPNARSDELFAPPPLPPPRYIEDLAAGSDPGWKWGNLPKHGGFGGSFAFPGSSSSSARGSWDNRMEDEGFPDRPEDSRRGSSSTTIRSPPSYDRAYNLSRNIDEGYHSLSGSSLVNYRSVNVFFFPYFFCCTLFATCKIPSAGTLEQLTCNPSSFPFNTAQFLVSSISDYSLFFS